MRTIPAMSAGYIPLYTRTFNPPKDHPASTYGAGTEARWSSACKSAAIAALVRGNGPGSLQPSPARSYQQAVVNFAISGWMSVQKYPGPPAASRITGGVPAPEQKIFKVLPPTSTELPICGNRWLSRLSPTSSYARPAMSPIAATDKTSNKIFLIACLMADGN